MATSPTPVAAPREPSLKKELTAIGLVVGGLLAFMWLLEIVDQLFLDEALDRFGIHPRSVRGLPAILSAPFLHAGFRHIIANTAPFAVLAAVIMLRRKADLLYVSAATIVVGGLGVWLTGASDSVHLGASMLVFGYLGFLLSLGIFQRKLGTIALSVVIGLAYGGALFGVLPGQRGISWQSHLFGFVGGVLAAWAISRGLVKPAAAGTANAKIPARPAAKR